MDEVNVLGQKPPDEAMATFGYKFSRKLETKRGFDDIRFGSEGHL